MEGDGRCACGLPIPVHNTMGREYCKEYSKEYSKVYLWQGKNQPMLSQNTMGREYLNGR